MELFQAEWCPFSHNVRQRLTELGLDFVARQVPADPDERDEIPLLVTDEGERIDGEEAILAYLERYPERPDAPLHRAKSRVDVPNFRA